MPERVVMNSVAFLNFIDIDNQDRYIGDITGNYVRLWSLSVIVSSQCSGFSISAHYFSFLVKVLVKVNLLIVFLFTDLFS